MKKEILTEEQIQEYLEKNSEYLKESNNPYVRYFFKIGKKAVTIYTNGRIYIQGEKEANEEPSYDSPYDYMNTIGADEVGTGDTFGPIVCASCFVKAKDSDKLRKMGIKDSKKLNEQKILELGEYVLNNLKFKAYILTNEKYNEITDEYNMNAIKARIHNLNIENLSKEVNYDLVCLDEFVNPKKYFSYLEENHFENICFETKGETKSVAVACASILARYLFLKEIEKMESKYNLKIPKGSSKEAQELVNKLKSENPELLSHIAKLNFKNIGETT